MEGEREWESDQERKNGRERDSLIISAFLKIMLHNVLHTPISNSIDLLSHSLSYLTLEPGKKYAQNTHMNDKKNNIDCDWNDGYSTNNQTNEMHQCNKLRINRFYSIIISTIAKSSIRVLNR